jgi:hypothetical protein
VDHQTADPTLSEEYENQTASMSWSAQMSWAPSVLSVQFSGVATQRAPGSEKFLQGRILQHHTQEWSWKRVFEPDSKLALTLSSGEKFDIAMAGSDGDFISSGAASMAEPTPEPRPLCDEFGNPVVDPNRLKTLEELANEAGTPVELTGVWDPATFCWR